MSGPPQPPLQPLLSPAPPLPALAEPVGQGPPLAPSPRRLAEAPADAPPQVGPAVVASVAGLQAAAAERRQDIEVRSHLDLRGMSRSPNPALDGYTNATTITLALLYGLTEMRSFRVRSARPPSPLGTRADAPRATVAVRVLSRGPPPACGGGLGHRAH